MGGRGERELAQGEDRNHGRTLEEVRGRRRWGRWLRSLIASWRLKILEAGVALLRSDALPL